MKDKIIDDAMRWYESQEKKPNVPIEEFIEIVMNKTAEYILEEVKGEFKNEFSKGNLSQPFVISSDYYLDLKMKEIKQKCYQKKIISLLDELEKRE